MKLNVAEKFTETTHEGAPAVRQHPMDQLRRSVLACMLWEQGFYENGVQVAERIRDLVIEIKDVNALKNLALEARKEMYLRHVPLYLVSLMAKYKPSGWVSYTLNEVVQRADELSEFLAIHAAVNGVKPSNIKPVMSAQVKKGLAKAFTKFDEYQLAKYNRDGAIKLRDVLFLCHAKPQNKTQADLWQRLIDGTLKTPDTWEVGLSTGGDKKEVFTKLLAEGKLGYMALLRNLRNMQQAGVDVALVDKAIRERKGAKRVLPFRYVAAAKAAPQFEPSLDLAMQAAIEDLPSFDGRTFLLIDVSGSMSFNLSDRSDITYMTSAATLAAMVRSDAKRVFTFSNNVVEVPPRAGMAGVDAVIKSQPHGGTYLGDAVAEVNKMMSAEDRLIVITDEQSYDPVPNPVANKAYMINVASNKNSVGSEGKWEKITGWSENVLRYIMESERLDSV